MILCVSTGRWGSVLEEPEEVSGEVALDAAVGFAAGLVFLGASFDRSASCRRCPNALDKAVERGPRSSYLGRGMPQSQRPVNTLIPVTPPPACLNMVKVPLIKPSCKRAVPSTAISVLGRNK